MGKLDKLSTLFRLGPSNLLRVAAYRTALRYNCHPVQRVIAAQVSGRFFEPRTTAAAPGPGSPDWHDQGVAFGYHRFPIDDFPPDWFLNRLNNLTCQTKDRPWWELADFDSQLGDIKGVWELSRFDWVLAFAQQSVNGDSKALVRLNDWLQDWCQKNPCYFGPNWKCGQEASIRVLHLILAAEWLGQSREPTPALVALVTNHLRRIAPTISYAVGQNNNHATSEAAALYIAGSWLNQLGVNEAKTWHHRGRYWLQNRARVLIQTDGTFSQYSANYHRLMLDAYCLSLWWQQRNALADFSLQTMNQLKAALEWLESMVCHSNGRVPNIGANDGANLLPLTKKDYLDYRPTIALASRLLSARNVQYEDVELNEHLRWLGLDGEPQRDDQKQDCVNKKQIASSIKIINACADELNPQSRIAENGGFAVLRNGILKVLFRYPRYRFRPSHCDALHVDLWINEENILRDAGSFSYNCEPKWESYFRGTSAHNTIEFDGRDQMPRLSRFLRGNWLKTIQYENRTNDPAQQIVRAGYRDYCGASHIRELKMTERDIEIKDKISGFRDVAVLRWRLPPGKYELSFQSGTNSVALLAPWGNMEINSDKTLLNASLNTGWESLHYGHKAELPVLEVSIAEPALVTTKLFPAIIKNDKL